MINKITINNIASYKEETFLETKKKVNLIYGLNGTGKTILSSYLQDMENDKYKDCGIEGFDANKQKILVYNQKFVDDKFDGNETQRGIFTLDKDNKEALSNIDKATQQKKILESKLQEEGNALSDQKAQIDENHSTAIENIWEIKKEYEHGVFDFCLEGYKRKDKLFEYLLSRNLEESTKSIKSIEEELLELGEGANPREELKEITYDSNIESNQIFQEGIIGNENSAVSNLIKELKNADWVRKGLGYVNLKERENCPFCQEKTMTKELVSEIESYFDKTYEEKITQIKKLKTEYQNFRDNLNLDSYKRNFFKDYQNLEIEKLFNSVTKILDDNLEKIKKKISQPSQIVELESSKEAIQKVNQIIQNKNKEIEAFNTKLTNREQTIQELKEDFWKIQRKKYDRDISNYNNKKRTLQKEQDNINKEIEDISKQIKEQNRIIKENQRKTTSIETVIDKINVHLSDFGIKNFKIVKNDEKTYKIERTGEDEINKIERTGEDENKFKSLSEGEKTVISFLYFVELCIGKENTEDIKEKIVVIDDPMSSLSHMYVFNVAQLIKTHFTKNSDKKSEVKQCFILTHSLYFFYELMDKKKKEEEEKQGLFRITKSDSSKIEEMKRNEIQNEYDSYWDIVKTANEANRFIVANAMRNIIEHFFCFVDKEESINNIFQKEEFKGDEYQSFRRYIERESHSDRTNFSDSKEINIEFFKKAFRKVFEEADYKEHYDKYIK